jgi:predicted MPP superfamily phosphohydrolase
VLSRILLVLSSIAVVCIVYGVAIERRAYRLVRRGLAILPADGPETVTVLHLSDLHFVTDDPRKHAFLATIPRADVTVVTGDFLAEPEAVETAVAAVRETRGRLASWYVLGSNDYYASRAVNPLRYFVRTSRRKPRHGRRGPVRRAARPPVRGRLGRPHEPARRARPRVGWRSSSLGLDDAHIRRQDLRVAPRRSPSRFGIAVMHSPDSAPEVAACGYPFVVAGHTHGGQVRLPLVGALVTNSHLPRRLVSGLIRMGGSFVHVSPGLGTSRYAPFRFLCPPEATLLELRRAPGGGSLRGPALRSSRSRRSRCRCRATAARPPGGVRARRAA